MQLDVIQLHASHSRAWHVARSSVACRNALSRHPRGQGGITCLRAGKRSDGPSCGCRAGTTRISTRCWPCIETTPASASGMPAPGPRIDRKEAMKRHWGGGAVRASLSSSGVRRGGVGPRVAGDHGCLCRGLRGHAHAWLRPGAARCHRSRHRRRTVCRVHRGRRLAPLCSRTLANGFSARVQEDDDADQNSSNDHSTDRDRRRR